MYSRWPRAAEWDKAHRQVVSSSVVVDSDASRATAGLRTALGADLPDAVPGCTTPFAIVAAPPSVLGGSSLSLSVVAHCLGEDFSIALEG